MCNQSLRSMSAALAFAAIILVSTPGVKAQAASSVDIRHKNLRTIEDDYWDFTQREHPETATLTGEYKYNDKFSDYSLSHVREIKQEAESLLRRVKAMDLHEMPEQDQIDKALLVRLLQDRLEGIRLKTYEMPVDQMNGVHIYLPQVATWSPFDSVRHYDDWIARLHQVPRVFDQVIEVLKQGEKDGLVPPRYLLESVVAQCAVIERQAGETSPFATPIARMPASFSEADKKRIREEIVKAVDGEVRPAYAKLQKFVAEDYAPKGRVQPGIWSLPKGDELYRFAIHVETSLDTPPEQIHALGLAQVAEVEAEISALAKKAGYPDAKSFVAAVHADPRLKAKSREQILDNFRHYIGQMEPKLPQLFGLLPKDKLIVVSVPEFMEKESSTQYQQGTADGSRPGQVWVDTYDPTQHDMLDDEATSYHEGVPGHHMQISIAQERPELHPFHHESADLYNAYAEGWALYAERLGKEVGFYQDPASDLGRLQSELFRAVRLVVDSGVHYKHWSRKQMEDYFQEHFGSVPQAEVDRYIVWPGQALGYKLGQLKILELRQRAQTQLGDKFDIRAFHDEILNAGPLPLNMLEDRINAWIAARKAAK